MHPDDLYIRRAKKLKQETIDDILTHFDSIEDFQSEAKGKALYFHLEKIKRLLNWSKW